MLTASFCKLNNFKMSRIISIIILVLTSTLSTYSQDNYGLPKIRIVDYKSEDRIWFAKYAQCQLNFGYVVDSSTGLPLVKEPIKQIEKIRKCLEIAKQKKINVIIFPELAISLPQKDRLDAIGILENFARENDAIIIAGTYYDENRNSRIVTILPNGTYLGYKVRPSRFEVSPIFGKGMQLADTLLVFKTKYGNFLPITCVDLISDDVNYTARNLSNKGIIDILININYNPKSQEFMREASSMVVRHPLIVNITNVSLGKNGCSLDGNEYGNTSVFGLLREDAQEMLLKQISNCYKTTTDYKNCQCDIAEKSKTKTVLQPAYKALLSQISPEVEGVLNYEINLRLIRTPSETNAPDQGYPSIKNLNIIKLN